MADMIEMDDGERYWTLTIDELVAYIARESNRYY